MNSLIYTALCATVDSLIHIVNVLTASQTIIQMLKCIIKLRKSGHWKNADFNKMRGNQVWRKFKKRGFPRKCGDFTGLLQCEYSARETCIIYRQQSVAFTLTWTRVKCTTLLLHLDSELNAVGILIKATEPKCSTCSTTTRYDHFSPQIAFQTKVQESWFALCLTSHLNS